MTYYQPSYYGYYPTQPMMVQQPMYPQQQQMVESNIQPQNMNVQPVQTTSDSYFIWVQGEAGAKSYPVARGTTLPLFDSEGDFVYFKSVDSNGVPLPLVTKVLSDPIKSEPTQEPIQTQIDMSNYVTKESYDALAKMYSDLESRILELETKPSSGITTTFTGNTFNNTRKDGKDNGTKFTV